MSGGRPSSSSAVTAVTGPMHAIRTFRSASMSPPSIETRLRTLDELARCGCVVERGPGLRVGQDPAVEDTAGDDGDPALHAEREELRKAFVVEKRVAAGHEEAVHVGLACEAAEHGDLIAPDPDGTDRSLALQLFECRVGARQGPLGVVVRVMNERNVDAVEAKSGKTFAEGAQSPLTAEIEDGIQCGGALPQAAQCLGIGWSVPTEQSPDLRRQDVLVSWAIGEKSTSRGGVCPLYSCDVVCLMNSARSALNLPSPAAPPNDSL